MRAPAEDWTCPQCGAVSPAEAPGARCPHDGAVLVPPQVHAKAAGDPFLGRVLAGKYALYSVIGKGGFGAVYKAVQEPVDRVVAVKLIRRDIAHRPGVRDRFYREARVVARINHPGAVTLFDYGEDGGTLYMVFEYVEGIPLSEVLKRAGGPLAPERAGLIARHLLDALAEAHAQGAVHRDLKPDNVMLVAGRDGAERVKVLDFGIAKVMGEAGDEETLTSVDVVVGTPQYMAPEQADAGPIDGRTDLYAVGVILHQMLSGQPPYKGTTPFEILLAHREAPVPPLPAALGVPPALAEVVRLALQKSAADRPPDARTMARAIDLSLGYTPAPALAPEASFDRPQHTPPPPAGNTSKELYGHIAERIHPPAEPPPGGAAEAPGFSLLRPPAWMVVGGAAVAAATALWVVLSRERAPAPPAAPQAPVSVKLGNAPTPAEPPLVQARKHLAAGRIPAARLALLQAHAESGDSEGFWQVVAADPRLAPLLDDPEIKAARPALPQPPGVNPGSTVAPGSAPPDAAASEPPRPIRKRPTRRRTAPPETPPETAAPARPLAPTRPASKPPKVDIETF